MRLSTGISECRDVNSRAQASGRQSMTSQTRRPLQHRRPKSPDQEPTMAATEGNVLPVWAQPAQLRFVSSPDLRCPNCNSTDLKKVSLAYQEGLFHVVAHTRLRAVVLGGSGPDLVIGKATTRGFHQSVLSKKLSPPVKWSYRKLVLWWVVLFLSAGRSEEHTSELQSRGHLVC